METINTRLTPEQIDILLSLAMLMKDNPMLDYRTSINEVKFTTHWNEAEKRFEGVREWGERPFRHHYYASTFGYLLADVQLELSMVAWHLETVFTL